jgi:hypothetical protein
MVFQTTKEESQMNAYRKFWLVLAGVVVAMALIACSCGTLIPKLTPTAYPTLAPVPTLAPLPTMAPSPTSEPLPTQETGYDGMDGRWLDPDTSGTVTTIEITGDAYAVTSVINPERGVNELTETNWSDGVLTWTYCISGGNCITSVTGWVSATELYTTWTDDRGYSGETTFQRLP